MVCAHDEEENLKELLPLLYEQDYPDFEVVVVDDRSNDNTYDFLLHEKEVQPKLNPVFVSNTPDYANGKKWGLTLGIKAAKHEWVLLTDADCRPNSKEWIKEMASGFTDENTFVLGYSPYYKNKGLLNAFIRFETLFVGLQYLGFARSGLPYMGVGRNLAYRKSFFLEKKGFHDFFGLTGGDDDLWVNRHARRKNTQVVYNEKAITWSIPEEKWSTYYRQKKRHLSVGKLYRFRDRFLLGGLALSHVLLWLLGIGLLAFPTLQLQLAIAWGVRFLSQYLVFALAARRLGYRFDLWLLPILDFLYLIYYFRVAMPAQFAKRVQWRN
ncbi:MAG TPA: poly-beta-1,6-N-acetyl-D-glucosamine synthase [Cytophagales bacterium]|nr:poly-beta-1,6-N-acetyl-D-glucosamine synthase [Cytophagales bacterium]HAA20979.1 poly-beta-1,6-N-acetyl-D-glucosamine synthase [Cytophagales bacterium]HAP63924.1 poly-beta-1,6-N-acetyl-D-glucosamine synthase [Cytophagales bacterium]